MVKFEARDISLGLQRLRAFLLGREHNLHGRFTPLLSPRTIPAPDIPRAPEYKYSNNYYYGRSAIDSVKPPFEAPVAEGRELTGPASMPPGKWHASCIYFNSAPMPGLPWWWDGHCYFEYVPDPPCPPCCRPPPPAPC